MHYELEMKDFSGDINVVITNLIELRDKGATVIEYVEGEQECYDPYVIVKDV